MENKLFFCANKAFILSRLLCFCCLFMGLYSCQEEDNTILNTGKLSFQMGVDTTLVGSSSTRASNILELSGFDDPDSYKVVISQDSGVVAEYARFDKMPAEIELEAGAYSVEVSKGTKTAAAFNSPYFSGKQDFTIVKDMTTPVEVTASMENSRVTVDFSDDFLETYEDYTLSFMTNKMTLPLVYEKGEYRPMYFQADASGTKLTIGMELVNVYGKDVQYTATTTIKQKQWTKLTVRTDEKGLNGVAIDVVLNDETKETVVVNIGIPDFMEKLKGAPYISSEVFHWDDTNESMEEPSECTKEECSASATVDVTAGGKVNQVLLTLKDASNTALINQYDLVNLTDEQAKYLKDSFGFELSENELKKGSMSGLIDLKAIISALPGKIEESYYELSLTVVDAMPIPNTTTKTVKITVPKVGDNSIDWGNFPSDAEYEYGSFSEDQVVEMTVPAGIKAATISIDGLGIEEQDINTPINGISVKKEADKVSLTFTKDWLNSLSFNEDKTPKNYTITLNVIDNLDRTIDDNSRSFTVKTPVFAWAGENSVDAFAKYVFLKIQTSNPKKVTLYGNGQLIDSENVVTLENPEPDVVTFVWKNLKSATSYEISAKYNNDDKLELDPKEFITESEGSLPNAGFENWYSNKIDENGKDLTTIKWKDYVYWNKWYPWNEEDENSKGWNTLNLTTTQYGGEPSMNTFLVTAPKSPYVGCCYTTTSGTMPINDAYSGNYAALIRTVGWGKENTATANPLGGMGTCQSLTPGELYLGTYNTVTHSASYGGYSLESRPFAVSFAYKYVPKNSADWGLVIIEVKDASGNNIVERVEKRLVAHSSYVVETIKLNYTLSSKATKILVYFKSSGNSECWTINESNLTPPPAYNLDTGEYVGSQLYIDDVELIYDYE